MIISIKQPLSYSHIGRKENQEDAIYPPEGEATYLNRFFVLCDGMGGHNNGEVASSLVCETLGKFFSTHPLKGGFLSEELFKQGLSAAYRALDKHDDGSYKKMGTTLTFIYLHRGGCLAAHIGDSRIYHIRPEKGLMYQSSDHSLVNELLRIGEITPEEALHHPQRNVITRAMQPHLDQRYKAEIHQLTDIQQGDYLFLCSDGVLEQLTNEKLVAILSNASLSDEQKKEALEQISLDKTRDNFTAYLVPINQVVSEENDYKAGKGDQIVAKVAYESTPNSKKNSKLKSFIKSLCNYKKERSSKEESTR